MRARRTDGPGPRPSSRTLLRSTAVAAAGALALLGTASPAAAHEGDEFKVGHALAALATQGDGVNMSPVANLAHQGVTTPQAAQNGSDIEFFRARGKDYALAGTLRNGLQINDISDPTARSRRPSTTARSRRATSRSSGRRAASSRPTLPTRPSAPPASARSASVRRTRRASTSTAAISARSSST